jgi:hypothetical protein
MKELSSSGIINKIKEKSKLGASDLKITSLQRNGKSEESPWKLTFDYKNAKGEWVSGTNLNELQVSEQMAQSITGINEYEFSYVNGSVDTGNAETVEVLAPGSFLYMLKTIKTKDGKFTVRLSPSSSSYHDFTGLLANNAGEAIEAVKIALNNDISKFDLRSRKDLELFLKNKNKKK